MKDDVEIVVSVIFYDVCISTDDIEIWNNVGFKYMRAVLQNLYDIFFYPNNDGTKSSVLKQYTSE